MKEREIPKDNIFSLSVERNNKKKTTKREKIHGYLKQKKGINWKLTHLEYNRSQMKPISLCYCSSLHSLSSHNAQAAPRLATSGSPRSCQALSHGIYTRPPGRSGLWLYMSERAETVCQGGGGG